MIVTRALYGLKSSGASWRSKFSKTLYDMDFQDTKVDPDVYRRKNVKENGEQYYELVLVYVDDCLVVSHDPKKVMSHLAELYELRGDPEEPKIYLGAEVEKVQLEDGRIAWALNSKKYVKQAVRNVSEMLEEEGLKLRTTSRTGNTPLPNGYKPEVDVSDELQGDKASRYLQLIGILRWIIELGRVDISYGVAIMSQYSASPRKGHLEAVYHIFSYLAKHEHAKMVFDPTFIPPENDVFQHNADWKDFYGDVIEELPPDMPEPLGKAVLISCFVDANHAGNVVTRRSHTGIIIFVMNAPIIWFSKKQNTVESSTFGSELVALRIAKELIVALRIKLRMFGVPVDGPADVYCDNQGVVNNTSKPESTLSKKHNSINYHIVREAAAAGILRVGKEDTQTNIVDVFTKALSKERRNALLSTILWFYWNNDKKPKATSE
jgi:hypothetical protein